MALAEASTILQEPEVAVEKVGLRYVTDAEPGIRRRRRGRGFSYHRPDGSRVPPGPVRDRIEALAIPPAWEDVWICATADGHVQATGRDARGRKQYRYHTEWQRLRSEAKFDHAQDFGEALPRMRREVAEDLLREGLPREKVLATLFQLLNATLIRVGNRDYATKNGAYGLTTLREENADVEGPTLRFHFTAKGGKERDVDLADARLARIVRQCQEIRGQRLFHYRDRDGEVHPVDSEDVNAYLQRISGGDFTAKDFRTWGASVRAFRILSDADPPKSAAGGKRRIDAAVRTVAGYLGNTPATARKYYVHPAVGEAYLDGSLLELRTRRSRWRSRSENGLLKLLRER